MFRTVSCLTEQHTGWVVPLAALVCWVSVHTALRLVRQSREGRDAGRWLWLVAAGFSAGAGVWSTHFIGMLGYDPGVVIGYDPHLTLASLSVAVVTAAGTFVLLRQATSPAHGAVAGLCFGLGVGAMHFSGMAGVEVPGALAWTGPLVVASLLIGTGIAATAFAVFANPRVRHSNAIAATLLSVAIAGLHFTAMAAVEVIPGLNHPSPEPGLPRLALAFGVAAVMLTVLGFAVLALFADRMRRANQALSVSEQRFRLLAENTTDVIIWCHLDGTREYVSPAAKGLLGYEPGELVGTRPLDSVHPDEADDFRAVLSDLRHGRVEQTTCQKRYRRKDGSYVWVEISFSRTKEGATGGPSGWVASLRDISARKEAEQQITHMALHDALTGLPNRLVFRDRLNQELANARRYGGSFAVLACDLDRFKAVNDTLGHPAGDQLLRIVADRLISVARNVDTVARLGGDEFAIILSWLEEPQVVSAAAERIIEFVGLPIDLDGNTACIGISIGIAMGTVETEDADALFKNADIALYRAKAAGRNTLSFYEPGMDEIVADRSALERDLSNAVREGGFVLHYQPIMNLAADRPSGFEALIRWQHPVRGMVSPADFIPLAEDTGLIVPLGAWILREACREAAGWPGDLRVAVNVSAIQFQKPGFEQAVMGALAASGLAPQRLELEITESVLVADAEAVIACLHRLRALGVRIAMDDFGTGYSSLSYLRRFPFDKIKIDRSFIRDIADPDAAAIVRAIVGIGTQLGASITAEGVETDEQLARVRQEGCSEVQGFYFSRPLPARDALAFVAKLAQAAA
ncbi:EAL domain-containing protein [Methylobacterium sp. Leaf118]|uniref:EAL domain-containing protein n=1 Tax=Methylobacterium sp. Leaf118 TaxID=2876562 RepID=UPI001E36773D|nr:EAL domain-containing protein [Methylobacterium sp. Leaf118]